MQSLPRGLTEKSHKILVYNAMEFQLFERSLSWSGGSRGVTSAACG